MASALEQAWSLALARPADLDARQVLADALLEGGSAHGELMRLQLDWRRGHPRRADLEAREEELIATHAAALLGDATLPLRLELDWEAGFVSHALAISATKDLETLFQAPAGKLVRAVQVTDFSRPLATLAATLARHAPPTLTELRVGLSALAGPTVADVAPLFAALPRLSRLDVTGALADFSSVSSDVLASLDVGSFQGTEPTLTTLGAAHLPALKELQVVLSDASPRFPGSFLAAAGFPAVQELTLLGYLTRGHVEGLAGSPLLARLARLRLLPVPETGWDEALRAHAARFGHLERIEYVDTLDPKAPPPDLSDVLPFFTVRKK